MRNKNLFYIFQFLFILLFSLALSAQISKKDKKLDEYLRNGFNFLKLNQTDQAVQQYKKALKIDKSNHNAYYNLGLIYAKTKQFDKAFNVIDEALLKCNDDLGSFYRLKANCLSDLGKYDEALILFFKDLDKNSNDIQNIYYNLGYTYLKLGRFDDSRLYFKKFLEKGSKDDSNYNSALFYVGTCYMHFDDLETAIDYFDLALANSTFYSYYYNKAESLNRLRRNEEALLVINEGIKNNPGKETLYHKRYQIYRDLKEKDKAFEDLKKAYSLNQKDADILLDMGTLYSADNQMDEAINCYKQCIAVNKMATGAYVNLANIHSDNPLTVDSAEFYYKKAIEILPTNGAYYFNFANYYKDISNDDKAIEMYKKALEVSPDLSAAYKNMAILYSRQKNADQAIIYVKEALLIDPTDDGNMSLLASLYFEKEDYQNAVVFATQALRLNKKSFATIETLRMRATSRQILGDYKNALYDYLEILNLYTPEQRVVASETLSNIGYCYLEDDQLQNALKYFTDAVASKSEIDQLIGLFTVQYLLKEKVLFNHTFNNAKEIEPKLKFGFKGVEMLEEDGYFYTEKHKKVLKKIFAL